MPELLTFMYSDVVQNGIGPNGPAPQLIGPCIGLRPQYIPGNYSFGITFGIQGVSLNLQNAVQVLIEAPDGGVVHDSGKIQLPPDQGKTLLPDTYQGFVLTMDLRNVGFSMEGCYITKIILNDEQICAKDLPVFKRDDTSV